AAGLSMAEGGHYVGRDRAAWLKNDTVYWFDGQTVRSIADGLRNNSAPYLDGEIVVWTAGAGRTNALYPSVQGSTTRFTDAGVEVSSPATSASQIFWLQGGGVMTRALRGAEARLLAQGPCADLSTNAGMAVFTCAAPGEPAPFPWEPARE